ncbi:hypothetical protein Ahy_A09g042561 [Arachis hypogaea]|uniref:hAT-like transposase RNase-H fold domain-containing protein n=1 Tax=Arachis hypogaea TaxID=3818 RepID=A0A445BGB4_ARAHY|nr:hypothetical protein Ahy_A09g042561 [Arachis hypogaea]
MRREYVLCINIGSDAFDLDNELSKRKKTKGRTSGLISSPSVTKFDRIKEMYFEGSYIAYNPNLKSHKSILPFLKIFYAAKLQFFWSLYVTSNKYMKKVFNIERKIKLYCENSDLSIRSMTSKMQRKYDKYLQLCLIHIPTKRMSLKSNQDAMINEEEEDDI